jgi:hypothetical protein
MTRPIILLIVLLAPLLLSAQREYQGLPDDLDEHKLILLNYEPINISEEKPEGEEQKYIQTRKKLHNKAVDQANEYLRTSAIEYPFKYAIAGHSSYEKLVGAGYKYVLESNCFDNERLMKSPESGILLVYDFYIKDLTTGDIYILFHLDEMKVYDYRLIMKKLNKLVKKKF